MRKTTQQRFTRRQNRRQNGFTLIELMLVVAIMGILSTLALSSYRQHIVETNRLDAVSMLQQILSLQERHFRNKFTYTSDLTVLGYSDRELTSPEGHYLISAGRCEDRSSLRRCVRITAKPQGQQAEDGPLSLDSRGEQGGSWPNSS